MNTKKKLILTIVLLSYFITAIDGSIVITGVTKIAADLHLSPSLLSWVQNAYVLAWGGFMLLGGRLSDTFGRKRILNLSHTVRSRFPVGWNSMVGISNDYCTLHPRRRFGYIGPNFAGFDHGLFRGG